MFVGAVDYYIVYNQCEFACPKCHYIHFENMWSKYYKAEYERFEIRCLNSYCRAFLVVKKFGDLMLVAEKKLETSLLKINKLEMIMKRIDVQAHAKRYDGVDINDKLALIKALEQMIEVDRKKSIDDMKIKLEQLERGEIPASDHVERNKPKRTRKPKKHQQGMPPQEDGPKLEAELTADDEISNDEL